MEGCHRGRQGWVQRVVALLFEQARLPVDLCCCGQQQVGRAWELGEAEEVEPRRQWAAWRVV